MSVKGGDMYILAVFSLALCIINIAMVANQTKECSIATKQAFTMMGVELAYYFLLTVLAGYHFRCYRLLLYL